MAERVTPDSAIEGDRVRFWYSGMERVAVVLAARPAGKNFVDVQLEDESKLWGVFNYEVIEAAPNQTAAQPAKDEGLRHRIVRALWDAADICLTDEQLGKMADAVIEDVLTPVVDSELRDRIAAEIPRHRYWHPGSCECGWKVDKDGDGNWSAQFDAHVAQSIVDTSVAPVLAARAAVLAERDAEIARLRDAAANALANQTALKGMTVDEGATVLELGPPRELVIAWVDAARKMLGDAPNYSETAVEFPTESVSMEIKAAGEFERYVFTVQRAGKVTPHEARQAAEAELEKVRAELEQWRNGPLVGQPDTEATEQAEPEQFQYKGPGYVDADWKPGVGLVDQSAPATPTEPPHLTTEVVEDQTGGEPA